MARGGIIRKLTCVLVAVVSFALEPALAQVQCSFDPAVTTPLIDLTDTYEGESGGLYGGGSNSPPSAHEAEAIRRATQMIAPIDGAIVMISVGMSNTTMEFSSFVNLVNQTPNLNPALIVVDGAQNSQAATDWTNANAPTWQEVNRRLQAEGVEPAQVQIAWIKQAERQPAAIGAFPVYAEFLRDKLAAIARALKTNYPNVQLAFISSRTRACTDGSDGNMLNPEPFAYESAFSVRWLMEQQINGDPTLDPTDTAPLLLWGPYLWAQSTSSSDGFSWSCAEVSTDCTHPSESGKARVAEKLLEFFTSAPAAAPWFTAKVATPTDNEKAVITIINSILLDE